LYNAERSKLISTKSLKCQLAEVGASAEAVGDAAMEAEAERRRQEVAVEAVVRVACVRADTDRAW
jgi:hypothetical protein